MDRVRRATGAFVVALAIALVGTTVLPALTTAEQPASAEFQRTWERTDGPVRDQIVDRTWVWGPEAFTTGILEPYAEAPNGQRMVQYFDKTRMEITTDPDVNKESPWYVANGLLSTELITGRLQLGHNSFEHHEPARINIAGDPEDTSAPTYASFTGLLDEPAASVDSVIDATINRQGVIGSDPDMADYGVTAAAYVQETDHTVASVFWNFMISEGAIYEGGNQTWGPLFQNAFFATGLPISEAYWTTVLVAGEPQNVLVQAFERRILTYTPSNSPGWQVETGNVGRHYHQWRYEIIPGGAGDPAPPIATPAPTPPPAEPLDPTPTPPADDLPEPGLGNLGVAGMEPLGPDEYSPLSEPYLDVPVADISEIGWTVSGTRRAATLNQQKNISLVNNTQSPSGKLYYIVDFNDGAIFVSDVIDANYGINIQHTWRERGTFYAKAWSIDPITGIRTDVTEIIIEVS